MTYTDAWLHLKLTNMGRIAHMPDFLLYALCAGLLLALVAGPLGSFVVWRRMAYFGDTLAHSALFGVALGLLFDINLALAVIVGCLLLAFVLVALRAKAVMVNFSVFPLLSVKSAISTSVAAATLTLAARRST